MSYAENPYYSPEACGLTLLDSLEDPAMPDTWTDHLIRAALAWIEQGDERAAAETLAMLAEGMRGARA